ncbi:DUF3307 domain-containing protein [Henriciella sp.]|uniref:DUF3307 domain-containing protein n=1 Tax=Henriciella sp. TaxID=1968823 RepID=UPI002617284E|nr:DUF3307 domain-containing protein [Henriciella sp.]
MAATLTALLCAHFVADFLLQPAGLIRNKRKPLVLLGHAIIVLATAVLFLGGFPLLPLALLLGTHIVMDAVKVYLLPDRFWAFLADQGVHLMVILGLAMAFPNIMAAGWWADILPPGWGEAYMAVLVLLTGLVASLGAGAVLIRKATAGLMDEIRAPIEGLSNGGLYIGCLERGLVLLLILMGQPSGVGFLVAAKSILRFGDVTNPAERKTAEYIIIGTFMSFGWGLLVAVLTAAGVRFWMPGLVPVI